jgi:NAD(P)H-dependent flavin oxidoreductase YrpB (nitropropane dioxygenase family)
VEVRASDAQRAGNSTGCLGQALCECLHRVLAAALKRYLDFRRTLKMARIRTLFGDRLSLDVPVFGFSHSVDVTAALSQAGGIGVYGIAHDPPGQVGSKVKAIRAKAEGVPIAADIMMPAGMPADQSLQQVQAELPAAHLEFVAQLSREHQVPAPSRRTFFNSVLRTPAYFEGQLQALLASDIDVVAFGVGFTPDAVARLQQAGKVVGALIGSPGHFDKARSAGVDFVVAQGAEAGAHTGSIGTFVLVPEIVQMAGDLPVLAAGGIGHGAQIAAALAMGAQGVWMGTSWLSTTEHSSGDHAVTEAVRRKLYAAGSGDTRITRGSSGKPQRQVRSGWTDAWAEPNAPKPLGMPYQHALVGDLLTAINEHQVESLLYSPAGQGVAWTREQGSVREVLQTLTDDALTALGNAARIAG